MKSLLALTAAVTLSTFALADNSLSNSEKNSITHKEEEIRFVEEILKNEEMKRLHEEMTRYGMSEVGMEARRQMIGTEKGRAYHRALEKIEKNTAG